MKEAERWEEGNRFKEKSRAQLGHAEFWKAESLSYCAYPSTQALSWPTAGAEEKHAQVYLTDGGAALVPVDADLLRGSSLD